MQRETSNYGHLINRPVAVACYRLALVFCCALALVPGRALAVVAGPESYLAAIANAKPGAVVKLRPGLYTRGLPVRGLSGTADEPITIEGADPSSPPIFVARRGENTVSIKNASYVAIRNLMLDGRNLPVDAVKAEGRSKFAHHITIENLRISGYGFDQQTVGISTKCPAWNWIIRGNTIIGAGTGMYLGNSDGSAPFIGGLIEYNLVADSRGYAIQIKHQTTRSSAEGEPVAPQTTIIRHNVLSKQGNASGLRLARPNLLVGHFPRTGLGKDDRYAIYGNFFYANATEALFQGEGNVALYSNLFVNPSGDAIHIQPHHDVPKNVWLFDNTVVAAGDGIRLKGKTSAYLRLLQSNVVFAQRDVSSSYFGNLSGRYEDAEQYLVAPRAQPGEMDLQLRDRDQPRQTRKVELEGSWPDADRDFEGRLVMPGDIGAYVKAHPATWTPSIAVKPAVKPGE